MVSLQSQMTVVHIMNVALMPSALKGITTISPVNVIIHEADASATVNIYLFLTHRIFLKIFFMQFSISSFENEDNFQCFKNCFMLRHLVISECGGPPTLLVPGDTLTLQSPGYPVGYEPNRTCEWRFIAPPGYDLVFFLEVMLTDFFTKKIRVLKSCYHVEPFLSGVKFYFSDKLNCRP